MGVITPVSPGWDEGGEVRARASRNQNFSTRVQELNFSSRAERRAQYGAKQVEHRLELCDLLDALTSQGPSSSGSLRRTLEQNPQQSIQALLSNAPDLSSTLHQSLGTEALQQLFSLSEEGQPEIFLNEVLHWADALADSGKISAAALTYQFAKTWASAQNDPNQGQVFANLAAQAEQKLAVLKGAGPAGLHFEFLSRRFLDQTLDPAMFLGFSVAGLFAKGVRLKVLSELISAPEAGFFTRGFMPSLIASGAALSVEAPALVFSVKAGHGLMGVPENWSLSAITDEVLSNGITLLALHGGAAVSEKAFNLVHGVDPILGEAQKLPALSRISRSLLPQAGMLGGIMLGHRVEERLKLRNPVEGSQSLIDGLATWAQVNVAGHLTRGFLGKDFAEWEAKIDLLAQGISRGPRKRSPSKLAELSSYLKKNIPDFLSKVPAGFGGPMMIFSGLLLKGKDVKVSSLREYSDGLEKYNKALKAFDEAAKRQLDGQPLMPEETALLANPEYATLKQDRERFIRENEHFTMMEDPTQIVAMEPVSSIVTEDLHIGQIVDGRYQIEGVIGSGGMGVVYRCKHIALGKEFAMKVLRPEHSSNQEAIVRFEVEAKAASQIRSPHIIDISHAGSLPNGDAYFIMEFLDGTSLDSLVQGTPLPPANVVHVGRQIAEGLAAAHRAGILHRDLKPENIFLVPHGSENDFVKILDFGIAKFWTQSGQKITREGLTIGTPEYMSPEQAVGSDEVDHRSDIYSLGVILYEMASGVMPFWSGDKSSILRMHLVQEPTPFHQLEPPRNVPPKLQEIIFKAMAKRPEDRFQSMEELITELDKFKSDLRTPTPSEVKLEPRIENPDEGPLSGKGRIALVGGILAVGLSTLLAFLLATKTDKNSVQGLEPPDAPKPGPLNPDAASKPTITPILPDAPPTKKVEIITDPPDAHLFKNDQDLGANRANLEIEAGKTVDIEIRHKGYKTQKITLDGSQEKQTVRLEREKATGIRPPYRPPRPNPDKDKGSNGKGSDKPDFVLDPYKKHK